MILDKKKYSILDIIKKIFVIYYMENLKKIVL